MTCSLGLSGNQLVIFSMIHGAGSEGLHLSTAQFAYLANISNGSVKRALTALQEKGYVRFADTDPTGKRTWFSLVKEKGSDGPRRLQPTFRETVSGRPKAAQKRKDK